MPRSVNVSMWSVTTEALPARSRREEVAVRHQAEALVPRVVAGFEVRVDVVPARQLAVRALCAAATSSPPAGGARAGQLAIVRSTFFQRTIA